MGYHHIESGALARSVSRPPGRGRPTRFTPERIQQIACLVECGKSGEEIAALIGVTVGTLKVTCSKLGISLRRPKFRNGSWWTQFPVAAKATFAITARYKGEQRTTELPLTLAMIGRLALEASSRDLSINELTRNLVLNVARNQLVQRVLESDRTAEDSEARPAPPAKR